YCTRSVSLQRFSLLFRLLDILKHLMHRLFGLLETQGFLTPALKSGQQIIERTCNRPENIVLVQWHTRTEISIRNQHMYFNDLLNAVFKLAFFLHLCLLAYSQSLSKLIDFSHAIGAPHLLNGATDPEKGHKSRDNLESNRPFIGIVRGQRESMRKFGCFWQKHQATGDEDTIERSNG